MPDWISVCVVSLLLSLLTVAGWIIYSGLLSDITVRTGPPPLKKITFAYKFKHGPHRNCGQLFRESLSIGPKLPCIGVFYDDPKKERRLCAHPFIEIYRESQIHFMAPLARQGDFYVPEVRQVERRISEQEESHSDTEVSGADSNSEYSSGSGVLLTDSRETSPSASSVNSVPGQDQEDGDWLGTSSKGTSFKELDWEQTDEKQEVREEQLRGESNQKSLELPSVEWWGVVGGEE
uniref:Testis expressed 264, ER-phagy receptor n=1 Tax=Anabas testudineus TaxID=64144 RepID=A0AAQ6IK41_ANATE